MNEDLREIKRIVSEARSVVFFGGAGVSTASGIPDFRGSEGLYKIEEDYGAPPEEILSRNHLYSNPESFYRYYRDKMIYPDAKPNGAHKALAELENRGILTAVITQNIDGLHQAAGSENVIELHGSVDKYYCVECGREFNLDDVYDVDGAPLCPSCGEFIRPDIILYGEPLKADPFYTAKEACMNADVLIVGGTSLRVNPAASLVSYYGGKHFIIINKSPTPFDEYAEYVIREPIDEVLSYIVFGD